MQADPLVNDNDFVDRLHRAGLAIAAALDLDEDRTGPAAKTGTDGDHGSLSDIERVGGILAQYTPELLTRLGFDRASGVFSDWGLSTVIDENLRRPVIGPALFAFLHECAGLEATWPVGNAGLLHVYGYLLSTVPTPFGLKRERWIGCELTRALGMPDGAFLDALTSTHPPGGLVTLVTAALNGVIAGAAGPVAPDDHDDTAAHELGGGDEARPGNAARPGGGPSVRIVVDEFAGDEREEIARAVLVQGNTSVGMQGGSQYAVVYTIVLGSTTHLVTAFPVAATAESWLAAFAAESPRLRYNAAAHELPPRSPLASRRVRRFD